MWQLNVLLPAQQSHTTAEQVAAASWAGCHHAYLTTARPRWNPAGYRAGKSLCVIAPVDSATLMDTESWSISYQTPIKAGASSLLPTTKGSVCTCMHRR